MPVTQPITAAALAFACVALVAAAEARAQIDPGIPVPGVQQTGLLMVPGVQRELKLESKQVQDATALAVRLQAKLNEGVKPLQTLDLFDRLRKLRDLNKSLDVEARAAIASFLNETQVKRLRQISIRDRAGLAFVDPEVQDALKMNDRQRARVQSFASEGFEAIRAMVDSGRVDQREAITRAQAIRKALGGKLVGELNPDQKTAWDALIGAPFEVNYAGAP